MFFLDIKPVIVVVVSVPLYTQYQSLSIKDPKPNIEFAVYVLLSLGVEFLFLPSFTKIIRLEPSPLVQDTEKELCVILVNVILDACIVGVD
jgi:hypothetical protein